MSGCALKAACEGYGPICCTLAARLPAAERLEGGAAGLAQAAQETGAEAAQAAQEKAAGLAGAAKEAVQVRVAAGQGDPPPRPAFD